MLLPGTYDLATLGLSTALANSAQTAISDLDGMLSANLMAEVTGFSGGTSISALVQVTRDKGTTWLDVARFDFTGSGKKYCNLQRIAGKGITAYAALGAEGVNDGLFGPEWRAVVTSVGTFANTNLHVTLDAA
jgi:hypothetical protein